MNKTVEHNDSERILDVGQAHAEALLVNEHYVAPMDPDELHAETHRIMRRRGYVGLNPITGQPQPCDRPGCAVNHDDATVDPELMTGPAVSVDHVGLPSPDAHAVAAHIEPELETRVRSTIYLVEQSTLGRRFAARQIINTVREHDAGATRYTDRLTLHADDLDVPSGPKWQILDASDEETWHDITALVECEDPDCTIAIDDEVECVVVRSAAYASGFGHYPADAMVDVRIPASRDGAQA